MHFSAFTPGSFVPLSAQDEVERACSAMAGMRVSDRRDPRRMARRSEPVTDRGPDQPAPMRRRIARRLAGHDEQDTNTIHNRTIERAIEHGMGAAERMAMQIHASIGLYRSPTQAPVPATVKIGRASCRERV